MREEEEKKKNRTEKTGKSAGKDTKKTAKKELNSDEEVIDISSAAEDYKEWHWQRERQSESSSVIEDESSEEGDE